MKKSSIKFLADSKSSKTQAIRSEFQSLALTLDLNKNIDKAVILYEYIWSKRPSRGILRKCIMYLCLFDREFDKESEIYETAKSHNLNFSQFKRAYDIYIKNRKKDNLAITPLPGGGTW